MFLYTYGIYTYMSKIIKFFVIYLNFNEETDEKEREREAFKFFTFLLLNILLLFTDLSWQTQNHLQK